MAEHEEEEIPMKRKKSEPKPKRRLPEKIKIPRRAPSIVIPPRKIVYITADKLTCAECTCFPKEEPYQKPKKLNECQKSPLTLYELSAAVIDSLPFPEAFTWSVDDVASWIEDIGLPQYRECILDNKINGLRLLMLEDPSKLPEININYFEHIKMITSQIRKLYSTEFLLFARSVSLPPRKPLSHCTWFKSRTGPSWGIRVGWSRSDILRWMKIIMPEPLYLDHWDLVWYMKPDFPKVLFARVAKIPRTPVHIPHYVYKKDLCPEYKVVRKFRVQTGITESNQYIWMERRRESMELEIKERRVERKSRKPRIQVVEKSRLYPKKVCLEGLTGKQFVLARRNLPKQKFFS